MEPPELPEEEEPPDEPDEELPEDDPPPDGTALPLDVDPAGAVCCAVAGRGAASAAMAINAAAKQERVMSSSATWPILGAQQLDCHRRR